MVVLLMLLFVVILLSIAPKPKSFVDAPVQLKEKRCPPHKWSHVEQKDQNGEVVGWKLVCAHCGPLAPQEDVKREI